MVRSSSPLCWKGTSPRISKSMPYKIINHVHMLKNHKTKRLTDQLVNKMLKLDNA